MFDALDADGGEPGEFAVRAVVERKTKVVSAEENIFKLVAREAKRGFAVDSV
ncbi:hypothetical protein [Mycobacterium simulans]|uniref:hypothetical protein n=1 Tax=Mycobacterium simulans TaxID=627089 RepID=UPI001CD7E209|nr:hypothetical protein [Mycobacterium simulans]